MWLTKKQAIKKAKMMWNWISNETLKEKRVVNKNEYFQKNNIKKIPINECYLCEYIRKFEIIGPGYGCEKCPLKFTNIYNLHNSELFIFPCVREDSPYYKWLNLDYIRDYELASQYAKEIAELPEK